VEIPQLLLLFFVGGKNEDFYQEIAVQRNGFFPLSRLFS
jgi:hypothetical protein